MIKALGVLLRLTLLQVLEKLAAQYLPDSVIKHLGLNSEEILFLLNLICHSCNPTHSNSNGALLKANSVIFEHIILISLATPDAK